MWLEPITDRTAADVTARNQKAFFNVLDWARNTGNVEVINAAVNVVYNCNFVKPQLTAPTIAIIPTVEEFNIFLDYIDVANYVEKLNISSSYGIVPIVTEYIAGVGGSAPDYNAANGWEQNLILLREYIYKSLKYIVRCGVPHVGQSRHWQVRYRVPVGVEDSASPVRVGRAGRSVVGAGIQRQNSYRRY